MSDSSLQNKAAWEFDAYGFWLREAGAPKERAIKILQNPLGELKRYADYFDSFSGTKIANICGSCGKKAVPLSVLGAAVTVFDISEENRRYALELAEAAQVSISYEVCDILEIEDSKFAGAFDIVFMEGGVLHYFQELDAFMHKMHTLLKPGGKMICSDFHPFTKITDSLNLQQPVPGYFYSQPFQAEMAHARFYPEEIRSRMPKCVYRKYTMGEIINAVIHAGFRLSKLDEHPAWNDPTLPGEFTITAYKEVTQ